MYTLNNFFMRSLLFHHSNNLYIQLLNSLSSILPIDSKIVLFNFCFILSKLYYYIFNTTDLY